MPSPALSRLARLARPARAVAAVLLVGSGLVVGCTPYLAVSPGASTGAAATTVPTTPPALPLTVTVADAVKLRDGGAFVLDVRQPDEFAAGHIPGATLIPVWDVAGRLAEIPRDRQVLVVCRSGARSAQGRDILLHAGYPSVTSMEGGMTAWTAAGNPTTSGS